RQEGSGPDQEARERDRSRALAIESVELFLDDGVAGTTRSLKGFAVADGDAAAVVLDHPRLLQRGRRKAYGRAARTQHLSQHLVGQRDVPVTGAIVAEQQPARNALLHVVQAVAECRLRYLRERSLHVAH